MVPEEPVALIGLGISEVLLAETAAAAGLPSLGIASRSVPVEPQIVLYAAGGGLPSPNVLWHQRTRGWIEVGEDEAQILVHRVLRALDFAVYAAVSSRSVEDISLVPGVCTALSVRVKLDSERLQDIELALHEAVSNAVVHGNLAVSSFDELSVSAMERFAVEMAGRLEDPALGTRLVEVACDCHDGLLVVEVADQGQGFDAHREAGNMASGRGLLLIDALSDGYQLLDGGRRIRMRFKL